MDTNDKKQKRRENAISSLNTAITALDIAEKAASGITPATVALSIVKEILIVVRVGFPPFCVDCKLKHRQDSMANEGDYTDLGLACADVCTALSRGLSGKKSSDLSGSICDAIEELTT